MPSTSGITMMFAELKLMPKSHMPLTMNSTPTTSGTNPMAAYRTLRKVARRIRMIAMNA